MGTPLSKDGSVRTLGKPHTILMPNELRSRDKCYHSLCKLNLGVIEDQSLEGADKQSRNEICRVALQCSEPQDCD